MASFHQRLLDEGLINCDPRDLGAPDHDEDTETVVVLPNEVARNLHTFLSMWKAYGDTAGDNFTREEIERFGELFDSTSALADKKLLEWLGVSPW